jgi:hypothetical protein
MLTLVLHGHLDLLGAQALGALQDVAQSGNVLHVGIRLCVGVE